MKFKKKDGLRMYYFELFVFGLIVTVSCLGFIYSNVSFLKISLMMILTASAFTKNWRELSVAERIGYFVSAFLAFYLLDRTVS